MTKNSSIEKIRESVLQEKRIINEMNSLFNYSKNVNDPQEKRMIYLQIENLKAPLQKIGREVVGSVEKFSLFNPLPGQKKAPIKQLISQPIQDIQKIPKETSMQSSKKSSEKAKDKKPRPDALEKLSLKRMKKKGEKIVKKKEKKPSKFFKISSRFFHNRSMSFLSKGYFEKLRRDLIKSNVNLVPAAYISILLFTTTISIIVSFIAMLFFMFFNISAIPPFITFMDESFGARLLKVFWIIFLVPAATFIFAYLYPSLEKKSLESKINRELPFAAIHMASISGSMIEPSKIFGIIIATKEYPYLEKEFIKLQNEINIYGYDLVTALRNRSFNSPSRKLSDLYNGLATTITSGGDLPVFFDKRSQSLLFDHRLEMERQLKTAETFMDIYISVVVAAPMILMLVLMMMRISGLGISLSPFMISFVMILVVSIINIFFLTFLHLKQPKN
ncbi:MAG TPA: type II secretion system F family protein [Bacillota bacterium]|nr:type II secretion system F family protein [Bacillota bacterium]